MRAAEGTILESRTVDVSVVIPTYNRRGLLPRTIPALMQQHAPGVSFEVIFVSNGSTDDTQAILEAAAAEYVDRLRYFVIAPTGGPSAPRNVGIRAAKGDVVVILDDDVLPDADLVAAHAKFHRENPGERFAAVGEVYVPPDMLSDPMSLFHTFPYEEVRQLRALSYLHFWTCNVSLKRRFMLAQGMFDERFLYYEDMLCGHRLQQNGMELRFLPEARGQHLHQLKPAGIPSKGNFTGRWLHAFLAVVPDPVAKKRFGVLSVEIGYAAFAKRCVGRAALLVRTHPWSLALLRLTGGDGAVRTRRTDRYYTLLFQRHILLGYRQGRREGFTQNASKSNEAWVDRGESPAGYASKP